ncbi:MAG: family 10 glycosylhydrolase, partial [Ignavibacteriaceae bacterium]|nr:family 10 glycosylhydrolase [Ignavibacteriaceae bacterium]
MKKYSLLLLLVLITLSINIFPQSIPPKIEMRAAWIATVTNLDWPNSPNGTTEDQKLQLINLLDELKRDGINTIIFQIRTECDALYSSAYDPWSYWLTGSQGTPPYPYYNPLEFAVEEAHNRGMEIHAWFNPYRAVRTVGYYTIAPNHVSVEHPEWVLQISTFKFLNPGLPEVREYIRKVIGDVVSNYDVDGIHFDDYFYPYPPNNMTATSANNALDDAAFAADPRGFTDKNDWRRDNVNLMVQEVYDTIQAVKPFVKFGISPFGIWRHYYPPIVGGGTLSAYDDIFCDAIAWLHDRSIDYLTPQLYWPFGSITDYGSLQPWWADSVFSNERHYYPGHAYYRISVWSNPSEMPNQIRFDRANPKVHGGVFFRAKNFGENPKGVTDTLRNDLYRYISILPQMAWKDIVDPNPPQNLRYERLPNGQAGLAWDLPQTASDGDSASRYVVYRFNYSNVQPADLENSANILNVEGRKYSIPGEPPSPVGPYYFVVASLDRNYNESVMTSVLTVNPPPIPVLAFPGNGEINISNDINLEWYYPELAASYRLQISSDPSFASDTLLDQSGLTDTSLTVTGLEGGTIYYWRVNSTNAGGVSDFSAPFSFTTGYPATTTLVFPFNNTVELPIDSLFYWNLVPAAETYDLILANSVYFSSTSIVIDTTGLTDTTLAYSNLLYNTFYYWKVRAINQYGTGNWSTIFKFKTMLDPSSVANEINSIADDYLLEQNYPNPFNPTTMIRFNLSEAGIVSLKIYNLLGQEVASLINSEFYNSGSYELNFDASNLPSGIYFYRI